MGINKGGSMNDWVDNKIKQVEQKILKATSKLWS